VAEATAECSWLGVAAVSSSDANAKLETRRQDRKLIAMRNIFPPESNSRQPDTASSDSDQKIGERVAYENSIAPPKLEIDDGLVD
jgi:hypothetical protein